MLADLTNEATCVMDEQQHDLSQADRYFRITEAWLYASPDWRWLLEHKHGDRATDIREIPLASTNTFHISRPVEELATTRAELHRRLVQIDTIYRTLGPKERDYVRLRYWQPSRSGVTDAAIARALEMHRSSMPDIRRRVVETFRRGLFGF